MSVEGRLLEGSHTETTMLVEKKTPQVSIGLPVYNGQIFIRQALDSLLTQTFSDFELIISDNASTDGTEAICREYATKDRRIRYVRQDVNRGAAANFRLALNEAVGGYFMWAAADDFYEPTHISNLLALHFLAARPAVAMSNARLITSGDDTLGYVGLDNDFQGGTPTSLATRLALGSKAHYFIYGLWNRESLINLMPLPQCRLGDRVFIILASLDIPFLLHKEATYVRRIHPGLAADRYQKSDAVLAALYRSNVELLRSVGELGRRLNLFSGARKVRLLKLRVLFLYAYFVSFSIVYDGLSRSVITSMLKKLGVKRRHLFIG